MGDNGEIEKQEVVVQRKPELVRLDPEKMTEDQAKEVAGGLIKELKRLEYVENCAREVYNKRFPRNIVTPTVSVPSPAIDRLGEALKAEKNLVKITEEESDVSDE